MKTPIHSEWRALTQGKPGRRFQDRYDEEQRKRAYSTITGRLVRLVAALVAFLIGVVLVFMPGPAVLFFLISGGLLAAESRVIARGLDRTEVVVRAALHRSLVCWRAWSPAGKAVVIIVAVSLVSFGGLLTWRIVFG